MKQRRYAHTSVPCNPRNPDWNCEPFDPQLTPELPAAHGPWELISTQFVLAERTREVFKATSEPGGVDLATDSYHYAVVWTWGSL